MKCWVGCIQMHMSQSTCVVLTCEVRHDHAKLEFLSSMFNPDVFPLSYKIGRTTYQTRDMFSNCPTAQSS